MQLVDITLTPLQRRSRAVFVTKDQVQDPEVTAGDSVVLRDERGDYFAGTVVDEISGPGIADGAESRYLVHLGVRLPEEYAMLRLGRHRAEGVDTEQCGPAQIDDMQGFLDLIGEAREAREGSPRVPSQRKGG